MKKYISLLLSLCLLFLCSCGKKEEAPITFPPSSSQSTTEDEPTSLTGAPDPTELSPRVEKSTVVDTENTFSGYHINLDASVLKGTQGGSTLSGLASLPKISYSATAARTDMPLSYSKQSHSHGPASGGQPHHTVVDFQKTFDKFGAYTLGSESTENGEKVLYLTFDCGYEYENLTATVLDVLKEKQVPAAFSALLTILKRKHRSSAV